MYEDRTLVCNECGQEFVFTAGEQEFYAEKGFANDPKKCKACRACMKVCPRECIYDANFPKSIKEVMKAEAERKAAAEAKAKAAEAKANAESAQTPKVTDNEPKVKEE